MHNIYLDNFKNLSLIALSLYSCNAFSQKKINPDRPNIIIIMADDMGYSDIGCYGSEIATPNIDHLAANGVRFRNFYNNAKCCPTRTSLLTGLYNHEAGIGNMVTNADEEIKPGPYQGFLNQNCVTIAEVLRTAGYSTYMSGKWHVGERKEHWPLQRGFHKYFGLISGASSYFEIVQEPRLRVIANGNESWNPPADNFYMTQALSDTAVSYLKSHFKNEKERPFFLYLAYTSPHWPLHALEEDIKKYESKYNIGWDSLRKARYEKMLKLHIIDPNYIMSPRTPGIPAWNEATNKQLWIRMMQVYAAMIDRMDQGIGAVISELGKNGQMENTLIIFLADNGGCAENTSSRNLGIPGIPIGNRGSYDSYREPWANVSNTPYRYYKNWLHEGGIRTPLIVQWPSLIKKGGIITDQFGHIIDIMPTCCEAAGTVYPTQFNNNEIKPFRGKSLIPSFTGKEVKRTEPVFWEYAGAKALRDGDWKLVAKSPGITWELYDLKTDPTELHDLSNTRKDILQKMSEVYKRLVKELGVRLVTKNKRQE